MVDSRGFSLWFGLSQASSSLGTFLVMADYSLRMSDQAFGQAAAVSSFGFLATWATRAFAHEALKFNGSSLTPGQQALSARRYFLGAAAFGIIALVATSALTSLVAGLAAASLTLAMVLADLARVRRCERAMRRSLVGSEVVFLMILLVLRLGYETYSFEVGLFVWALALSVIALGSLTELRAASLTNDERSSMLIGLRVVEEAVWRRGFVQITMIAGVLLSAAVAVAELRRVYLLLSPLNFLIMLLPVVAPGVWRRVEPVVGAKQIATAAFLLMVLVAGAILTVATQGFGHLLGVPVVSSEILLLGVLLSVRYGLVAATTFLVAVDRSRAGSLLKTKFVRSGYLVGIVITTTCLATVGTVWALCTMVSVSIIEVALLHRSVGVEAADHGLIGQPT